MKWVFLTAMFAIIMVKLSAQSLSDSTDRGKADQRILYGFNYHLQISHLDLSPVVVIPFHRKIYLGFGLNYLYHYRNSIRIGKSSFGANVFARAFISRNIYGHLEYLYSDIAYLNKLVYEFSRVRKADFFIGGGYRQPISERIDGYITLLVNVNRTEESPYKNRILFKAGLTF